jgi:hypothetical protein
MCKEESQYVRYHTKVLSAHRVYVYVIDRGKAVR